MSGRLALAEDDVAGLKRLARAEARDEIPFVRIEAAKEIDACQLLLGHGKRAQPLGVDVLRVYEEHCGGRSGNCPVSDMTYRNAQPTFDTRPLRWAACGDLRHGAAKPRTPVKGVSRLQPERGCLLCVQWRA
jgi:hypothetical protein